MYPAPIRASFLFFGLSGVQISNNNAGIRKKESSFRMTKMVAFLYFNVYFTAPYEKCDTTGRVSVTGNYTRNLERFKLTCRQTFKATY